MRETTGTLTFPALETEQMIRVPIIDDDLDEADRSVHGCAEQRF